MGGSNSQLDGRSNLLRPALPLVLAVSPLPTHLHGTRSAQQQHAHQDHTAPQRPSTICVASLPTCGAPAERCGQLFGVVCVTHLSQQLG